MDKWILTEKLDWDKVVCPVCHEQRKNTPKNKIVYDPLMSDKKKGKMVFHCGNHDRFIMFVIQVFKVKDNIISVRQFVFQDRLPK